MSYKEIIDLWPNVAALARDLEEKPDTVRKWRERDSIPPGYWSRLIRVAKRKGYKVSYELLSSIVANKKDGEAA